jgi:hypothetical protein
MVETTTAPLDWRETFIEIKRKPRAGWAHIEPLLVRAMNVQVSLRQKRDHSLIVLKFPSSVQQLPENVQAVYSQLGISIEDAFSEVLWKKREECASTVWAELVREGYNAYRETWLHLLESIYLGHSHPAADKILREEWDKLRKETALPPGRRHARAEEELSLKRRFKELLVDCTAIHGMVRDCINKNLEEEEIKRIVFQKINGKRYDKYVLTRGGAWEMLQENRNKHKKEDEQTIVCLHDPTSWKPHQLAIALLAKERGITKYQTIEKMTAYTRKRNFHK